MKNGTLDNCNNLVKDKRYEDIDDIIYPEPIPIILESRATFNFEFNKSRNSSMPQLRVLKTLQGLTVNRKNPLFRDV